MCTIQSLNTLTNCANLAGGIDRAFIFPASELTGIATTTSTVEGVSVTQITGLTMATVGKIVLLKPARDESIQFTETDEISDVGRRRSAGEGILVFRGNTVAQRTVANLTSDCCEVVVIYVTNSGQRIVQGIEIDATATGGFVISRNKEARVATTSTTGASSGVPQITYNISDNANGLRPITTLSDSALLAL